MHKLSSTPLSLDSSVVVDFHLTGNLSLLEELFEGRMLLSDFVKKELADSEIELLGTETVVLSNDDEWEFLRQLRESRPVLGAGELGAITVARSRGAVLLTNDHQARLAAEQFAITVSGAIGVLEYGVEIGKLSGSRAVEILEDMIREGAWISGELLEIFRKKILQRD